MTENFLSCLPLNVDEGNGFSIYVAPWKRLREGTMDAYILAYALKAFGFVFFTLGGAGPSVARCALVTRVRLDSQRFTTSRRKRQRHVACRHRRRNENPARQTDKSEYMGKTGRR